MGIRVSARVRLQNRKCASVRACDYDCMRRSVSECVTTCTVSACDCCCVRRSERVYETVLGECLRV